MLREILNRQPFQFKLFYFLPFFFKFRYLIDLFKLGLKKPLTAHDMYKNLNAIDAAKLTEKFNSEWETELAHSAKRKPHIFNVIWKVCISKIIGFSFLYSTIDIFLRCVGITLDSN